jgi:organic hydroperoxide reductase OsmC/OhrA
MTVQAKRYAYAVAVDHVGSLRAEDGVPFTPRDAWTPEHLVLAGLARCSLTSLDFHARRAGLVVVASAEATGTVTRREEDGRYAFVEIACRIDAELDPQLEGEPLAELLAKAERDCFVGASLRVIPAYDWHITGRSAAL